MILREYTKCIIPTDKKIEVYIMKRLDAYSSSGVFTPFTLLLILIICGLIYDNGDEDNKLNIDNGIHKIKRVDFDPNIIIVNDIKEDTDYPYRPRTGRKMPMNIATRGAPRDYDTVGYLKSNEDNSMQKLFGRETYPGSNSWNYFSMSDDYHQIAIPLSVGDKDCTKENGCKEISDNEVLTIDGRENKATIYDANPYRYSPYY